MNKIRFSLIVFSLFFVNLLCAQANSSVSGIDSLKRVLDTIPEDKKAEIFNKLFKKEYKKQSPDILIYYLNEAVKYAKKYSDSFQIAFAYRNMGFNYANMEEYKKGLEYYSKAEVLLKKLKRFDKLFVIFKEKGGVYERMHKNKKAIYYYSKSLNLIDSLLNTNKPDTLQLFKNQIELLSLMSYIYTKISKYDKVAELGLKALKISEANNYKKGIIKANTELGQLYRKLNNFEKAQYYLEKALELESKSENIDTNSLFSIYLTLGLNFRGKKEYEKALKYINKSLKYGTKPVSRDDYYKLMLAYNSLALIYMDQKKYPLALKNYLKALENAKKSKSPYIISAAQINVGSVYEKNHKYKKAIKQYEKGLEIAEKYKYLKWQREACAGLSNCYKHLNNFEEAYYYFQDYKILNDSLKIEETNLKISELQTKYDTEKKNKQIQLLAKDNEIKAVKLKRRSTIMYAVIGFALLGLLFSLIYFNLLRQRQKAKELIKQQKAELKFTENLRNYYKLANMLPLVTFFVDKNKQVKYINDFGLKLFKIDKEKIANGVDIFDTLFPVNKDDFQKDILKVYDNQKVFEKQYQFNIDGKKYYFVGFFSPNVENGIVTGILGVMIDITKIREMQKEIEITAINTENKERKRFSADLHDGLGPLLSSIKLFISGLESASEDEKQEIINYVKNLIDDSINSVRIISNNILPVSLTEKGLIEAINSFSQKLKLSKGIDISIEKINIDDFHFDNDTKAILFRVLQELINNTIKHAEASQINIKFEKDQNQIKIQYSDNGKGFDFDKTVNSDKAGLGLKNILNRINTLGGTIYFSSEEGKGLTVDIYFDT